MYPAKNDSQRAFTNFQNTGTGQSKSSVKLGILLCEAQLISPNDLHDAIRKAESSSKLLGQVLVESLRINAADLENALTAQSMIQSGKIDRKAAAGALKCAKDNNLPFLQVTKWLTKGGNASNEQEEIMIELMLSASLVSKHHLDEARRISTEREITVLGALLKMRAVSFSTVNIVVECLKLVLDKKLDANRASTVLKTMKVHNCDFREALEKSGMKAKNTLSKIKIGDILLSAKVVTEADLLNSLEKSFSEKRMLGELLIEAGILSKDLLEEALFLQKLCKKDLISRQITARIIRKAYESNSTAPQVAQEMGIFKDKDITADGAINLLISANLVTETTRENVVGHYEKYGMDSLNALVAGGEISIQVYRASIELARLIANKQITKETATKLLYQCDFSKCTFREAFDELGLNYQEIVEKQRTDSIKSGLENKFRLPQFHKSSEVILLGCTFIVSIVAALLINLHLSQLFVAISATFIVMGASAVALLALKSRKSHMEACQTAMKERAEEAQQEVSRLRNLGSR